MQIRRALKQFTAGALDLSGARSGIAAIRRSRAGGRRVIVLGYHRVCADFAEEWAQSIESCLISRDTFARHVEFLSERSELATMSRAVDVLAGRAWAGRDLAVITFDDGYKDVLENAKPILDAAFAPATLYVSSDVVARRGYFLHDRLFTLLALWQRSESLLRRLASRLRSSRVGRRLQVAGRPPPLGTRSHRAACTCRARPPDQRDERGGSGLHRSAVFRSRPRLDRCPSLAADGWEIGSHTMGHSVLTHLTSGEIEADLRTSKAAIESAIGKPVRHFAYCNGYYNDSVIDALKRTGFASAVTTEDRLNRAGEDPFRVARRVLWEGSTLGATETSDSLLACQLDDTWAALGFNASESGHRPGPAIKVDFDQQRRLA